MSGFRAVRMGDLAGTFSLVGAGDGKEDHVVASRDHWHQRSALAALARERHEAFVSYLSYVASFSTVTARSLCLNTRVPLLQNLN